MIKWLLSKAVKERNNVECIVSPYEADAQLAYLSRIDYVDVVVSEDSDLLAFGSKRVLFKVYKWLSHLIYSDIQCSYLKEIKETTEMKYVQTTSRI